MKYILFLLALTLCLSASKKEFLTDYKQALKIAKEQNKDIYMLITSSTCQYCIKFEKNTLSDAKTMQDLREKFVLLTLNRDIHDIPSDFNSKRVPRHYFLTPKGEIIYSILGYWSPNDFAFFVKEVDKKK